MIILVNRKTRILHSSKNVIGNDGENLQEKIIFKFEDEFVDGIARLEYEIAGNKNYVMLNKEEESYSVDVLSVMTKKGQIDMQLVITEGVEEEHIPLFKSNIFYMHVGESINAVEEAPEGYDLWIEIANAKLNAMDKALGEVDKLDADVVKENKSAIVTITKKDGSQKSVEIKDGEKGEPGDVGQNGKDGKDALINGKNTISILAGDNVNIRQEDDKLYIDSEAGYGDTELRNKINIIDEDLGAVQDDVQTIFNDIENLETGKADKTEIPDVSHFITKTVNNLTNYYLKNETYTQEEVNQLIGKIKTAHFEVAESLPETGEENVIYLVPKQQPEFDDVYCEYVWINNAYELIGTTAIDLSNYLSKDELGVAYINSLIDAKIGNIDTVLQQIDTGEGI